jgi:4-amino-4-deoxy-L-arabinose transferase-like glycosyltransferase
MRAQMVMVLKRFDGVKNFADSHPVIAIMTLSLSIKLILFSFEQVINPDGVLYIAAAQQISVGNLAGALKLYPMPAYPLLLKLAHFVIPDWVAAARVINIAAMVLASIPIFNIARILFNRQAAFWAALCFALTPESNDQALSVIRDPVFLLAALTAVFFLLKGIRQQRLKMVVLALFFTGLSFLFRVEGVVFVTTPVLFFMWQAFRAKDDALKRFARKSLLVWIGIPLILMASAALILEPKLLGQNRVGELMAEVGDIAQLRAFDNYQEIYRFFQMIETEPPFSGFSKSLPAIVRHWMPLIYLIGLLEYFIKQIFPIFLLPLLFAGHRYISAADRKIAIEKKFILLTCLFYMLFIFYSFITRDFIQGRFLFTPAVLLYPWVGYGITLIFRWLKGIRFTRILQFALVLVLIVIPCVKSVRAVIKSDLGVLKAGRYVSQDTSLAVAGILFSDTRQWLYGDRSGTYQKIWKDARIVARHIENGDIEAIEELAQKNKAEALVLAINFNKAGSIIPEFQHYHIYKQFPSRKGVTVIYKLRES